MVIVTFSIKIQVTPDEAVFAIAATLEAILLLISLGRLGLIVKVFPGILMPVYLSRYLWVLWILIRILSLLS